jgi:hypothetical protein
MVNEVDAKDRKSKTVRYRLTAAEYDKLKEVAEVISDGNVSQLLRHFVEACIEKFKEQGLIK